MNHAERMNAALSREPVDRTPWVPAIYEHGAKVIGRTPAEAARSPELMAEAALASYERYDHDLVSVGVDIYNIEAEALGCKVSDGEGASIPGVTSHPLANATADEIAALSVPEPGPSNRLALIEEACRTVASKIGGEVWVNACLSGPFSQAVELRGFENVIGDMLDAPERVHALLEKTTALSLAQGARLASTGCGLNIFESWATLPLITPEMFGEYVVPYNKRIIEMVGSDFDVPPPALIMGGNTSLLIDHFIESGTSLVVADYTADFEFMSARMGERETLIRGCVDPKQIERRQWDLLEPAIEALATKSRGLNNFVWGCGAVSYETTPESLLQFKQMCADARQVRETCESHA
jgi:uroporphyrinogen decarboxylase